MTANIFRIFGAATTALWIFSGCTAPAAPSEVPNGVPNEVASPSNVAKADMKTGAETGTVHTRSKDGSKDASAKTTRASDLKIDKRTGLIAAEGYAVVAQHCTVCHSAKLVTQNRGDREHWKDLIVWMQKTQGLWQIPAAQEDVILDYLSHYYGAVEDGRRPALPISLRPPPAPAPASDARVLSAQRGLLTAKKALKKALVGSIKKGGITNAVTACSIEAPKIAAQRHDEGIIVGRTSDRLRNPKNTAPDWAVPLLNAYRRGTSLPYLTADLKTGGLGYVEPIKIGGLCLQCHGATIAPDTVARLAKLYPEDSAKGYQEGDFRGLFWVTVPPSETVPPSKNASK